MYAQYSKRRDDQRHRKDVLPMWLFWLRFKSQLLNTRIYNTAKNVAINGIEGFYVLLMWLLWLLFKSWILNTRIYNTAKDGSINGIEWREVALMWLGSFMTHKRSILNIHIFNTAKDMTINGIEWQDVALMWLGSFMMGSLITQDQFWIYVFAIQPKTRRSRALSGGR